MKPEALDAFATQTIRPGALEAATSKTPEKDEVRTLEGNTTPPKANNTENEDPHHTSPLSNLSAAKVVHDLQAGVGKVVYSAQAVINDMVAWTEKKAEKLSAEGHSAGPYTSPATCVPSDFDPVASGVLPAIINTEENKGGDGEKGQ